MNSRRWSTSLLRIHALIAASLVVACGKSPTSDEGWELAPGRHSSRVMDSTLVVDSAVAMLSRAGCEYLDRRSTIGAVAIPTPYDRFLRFDCHTISDSAIRSAIDGYREMLDSAGEPGMMEWNGHWVMIDAWQDCSGQNSGGSGYYSSPEVYVLPEIGVLCRWYYAYLWVRDAGGGEGGEPGPPPGGGSGGGGGGGSAGGGSEDTTFAGVNIDAPENADPESLLCDETLPTCVIRPMSSDEIGRVLGSLSMLRLGAMDTQARQECDAAAGWVQEAIDNNWLRAATTNDPTPNHWAQYNRNNGLIHIDPRALVPDQTPEVRRALLQSVMHEVAHKKGNEHPLMTAKYTAEQKIDYSKDPVFRSIESRNRRSSCIDWPAF